MQVTTTGDNRVAEQQSWGQQRDTGSFTSDEGTWAITRTRARHGTAESGGSHGQFRERELASITHQLRELQSGKNRSPSASILTILQTSEREIQKQFEQQMQIGDDLLQTELFDQAVRFIKNWDDTCEDIKEEYQKELTVFAQCLTDIRNALLSMVGVYNWYQILILRHNDRSNPIPGHNRVCKIVTIVVGRRRVSSSKVSRLFTSIYPRHPSVSSRTRCYLVSLNSFSRKLMGKGGCLFGGMSAIDVPPQTPCTGSFLKRGGCCCLFFAVRSWARTIDSAVVRRRREEETSETWLYH